MVSSLKILYCVEGLTLWQADNGSFHSLEIFISWFPLTWFSMWPLGRVSLLYHLPLLHWRTWAKKGTEKCRMIQRSIGTIGEYMMLGWVVNRCYTYNKGNVALFFSSPICQCLNFCVQVGTFSLSSHIIVHMHEISFIWFVIHMSKKEDGYVTLHALNFMVECSL